VHAGSIWARRRWVDAALTWLAAARHRPAPGLELHARLSEREREVFRYAAAGLGNKQLAERLYISEATVKVHMTHIFQKLGVTGRAELAAAYHGLIARPRTADAGTHLARHES
jgi:DNA-binding NarL/FixJ family response regulator